MTLKNNIATWKAMNGIGENKKFTFKILNKKLGAKKQSIIKKVTQNKLASNTTKKILNLLFYPYLKENLKRLLLLGLYDNDNEDNFIKNACVSKKNKT